MLEKLLIASAMAVGLLLAVACAGKASTTTTTSPPITTASTSQPSTITTSPPGATATTVPTRAAPAIPNSHSGRLVCKVCHANPVEEGGQNPPPFPAVPDHSAVVDSIEVCSVCHPKPF